MMYFVWCRGRGSRALLKWYRDGAVVHDASYHTAVQLKGPEAGIHFSVKLAKYFLFVCHITC
jgi:hypothetical protein